MRILGVDGVGTCGPVAPAAAGERVQLVVLGLVQVGHNRDVPEIVGVDAPGCLLRFRLPRSIWSTGPACRPGGDLWMALRTASGLWIACKTGRAQGLGPILNVAADRS
jgi:hypothetical protein